MTAQTFQSVFRKISLSASVQQFFSSKIIRHIVFHKNQHFSVLNLPLCVSNDPSADLAFFCGKLSNSIPICFQSGCNGLCREWSRRGTGRRCWHCWRKGGQIIHCCYFYTMNARQIPQQFLPQSVPFIQRNQARRGNFHTGSRRGTGRRCWHCWRKGCRSAISERRNHPESA